MKKININEIIKVKLTDYGKDIYYHRFDKYVTSDITFKYFKPSYPEVDENGYTEFQFWNFMAIFGEHMFNGCNLIIERNEIFIEDEKLEECAI